MKDAWDPNQYEKFKKQRSESFYDLMAMLNPAPGGQIIDLGCGTGELTAILHEKTAARIAYGIDSSDEMLKKVKAHAKSDLIFEKKDIATWEDREAFDIIFSNAAIQWCDGHPEIFKRLHQSLKQNGQLAIQMPMNHDYATHVLAQEMSEEPRWSQLLKGRRREPNMLSLEQYARLLFSLGFTEQKVVMKVYGHVLDSREGVIEWVKGTLLTYFEGLLTPEDYQKFLKEFRERLFTKLPDEKPFFYPFKRMLLWAQK